MKLDGVLTTPEGLQQCRHEDSRDRGLPTKIDRPSLERLAAFVRSHGGTRRFRIMLTSAWRYIPKIDHRLGHLWCPKGLPRPEILPWVGFTDERTTGMVLMDWMESNMSKVEEWAILDNNEEDASGFRPERTKLITEGFQDEHAQWLASLFGIEPWKSHMEVVPATRAPTFGSLYGTA